MALRPRNGTLVIEPDDMLVADRFCTVTGLASMGPTALKGNVYLEVDGRGNKTASGLDQSISSCSRGTGPGEGSNDTIPDSISRM